MMCCLLMESSCCCTDSTCVISCLYEEGGGRRNSFPEEINHVFHVPARGSCAWRANVSMVKQIRIGKFFLIYKVFAQEYLIKICCERPGLQTTGLGKQKT